MMQLATYLTALQRSEKSLADGLSAVAAAHRDEPEILGTAPLLASWSYDHVDRLDDALGAFGKKPPLDPKLLAGALFGGPREGPAGMLGDLLELAMLAGEVQLLWALAGQGARVLRAEHLLDLCTTLPVQTDRQKIWLETRIKAISPQILIAS
jgi:hypothetical protein